MTVAVEFQAVTLDGRSRDNEGVLVFRAERLMAILTRLSGIHGDHEGCWFIETLYGELPTPPDRILPDLAAAETWALAETGSQARPTSLPR